MEIELKYLAAPETAEMIFAGLKSSLSCKKIIPMMAIYFDTPDKKLRKLHVAVRVRKEGEKFVATCKWGGGSKSGLHKRNEVNVTLPLKDVPKQINRELFYGTPAYEVMGIDDDLVKLVEMEFVRTEYHLLTNGTTSAISYDQGIIKSINKEVPISEMEIELLEGNLADIENIGAVLVEKYGIEPCNISKLARGLAINQ